MKLIVAPVLLALSPQLGIDYLEVSFGQGDGSGVFSRSPSGGTLFEDYDTTFFAVTAGFNFQGRDTNELARAQLREMSLLRDELYQLRLAQWEAEKKAGSSPDEKDEPAQFDDPVKKETSRVDGTVGARKLDVKGKRVARVKPMPSQRSGWVRAEKKAVAAGAAATAFVSTICRGPIQEVAVALIGLFRRRRRQQDASED